MNILRSALTAQRLLGEEPAWRMLRARNAAVAVALLGGHLGGEQRRLPAPVLFERLEEDLEELRGNGFDLPQTAQAYCAEWRNENILIRRTSEAAREETLELSQGAFAAIRFVSQLAEPRQAVTESRLATILDRLRVLARDTDPDTAARLASLQEERDRLDQLIGRVAAGDVDILPPEQAVERARDILSLVEEVPADFARVRGDLEKLNRSLRERLIGQEESRGTVLEDIFRGVDLLEQSEAGRSFSGFYALLLDPERGLEFEDSIAGILERDFIERLTPAQTRTLRRILPTLQDRSSEIHAVMTAFSRSLRRFVQSQELQEDRLINQSLRNALREAMDTARTVRPYARTQLVLDLTSVPLGSVSALKLHNPADFESAQEVIAHEPAPVNIEDLRELARASEIDFKELTGNINRVLDAQGPATISDVLAAHPATQGVASVVGLLVLAEEQARPLDGREDIAWQSAQGVIRRGSVGRYLFCERINP
ncbi:DUF3375 domain-containing protein [Arthrobacter sp. I2-34]|uniref:DUF3375 domain-containing protein n=1 Tax=Arthrobacter hankyongi TaxID=2904801 RepID=A0ABS9L787_9MICC|nr:DUF3375 domain-containing protein [Arthrobacter hankyongi]MCG2622534.1 DUF3375 domain-containing protein [Arthrobacter hankyongi]